MGRFEKEADLLKQRELSTSGQSAFFRMYGGLGDDGGEFIKKTQSGGFIVAGNSSDLITGKYAAIVSKWNENYELEWVRSAGDYSHDDYGYAAIEVADLSVFFVGHSCSYYDFSCESFVMKISSGGDIVWMKTMRKSSVYNNPGATDSWRSIQERGDNKLVLVGDRTSSSTNYMVLSELNEDGSSSWLEIFSASAPIYPRSLQLAHDEDIIIAGYAALGLGGQDAFLMRAVENGSADWVRAVGGSADDYAYSTYVTLSGDIVLAGETYSYGAGNSDGFIMRFSGSGSRLWAWALGGAFRDFVYGISETSEGDIVFSGTTCSFGPGSCSVMLGKLNQDTGVPLWVRAIGDAYNNYGYGLDLTSDDEILVVGSSMVDESEGAHQPLLVAKLDKNGEIGNCSRVMEISPTVTDLSSMLDFATSFSNIDEGLNIASREENGLGVAFEKEEEMCYSSETTSKATTITTSILHADSSTTTSTLSSDSTTTAQGEGLILPSSNMPVSTSLRVTETTSRLSTTGSTTLQTEVMTSSKVQTTTLPSDDSLITVGSLPTTFQNEDGLTKQELIDISGSTAGGVSALAAIIGLFIGCKKCREKRRQPPHSTQNYVPSRGIYQRPMEGQRRREVELAAGSY